MKLKPTRRWSRVYAQIFVWAGEETLEIKYDGFRFKVPPRTETARKTPGSIYKFESARNGKDELIPGTILVEDVTSTSPSGGYSKTFDVGACCEYLARDKPDLFEQGFAIVTDVADIAPTMAELIPMYEETQDRRAFSVLAGELERQKKYEAKGQMVPERDNPEVVEWAIKHLARRRKTVKPAHGADEIQDVLQGRFAPAHTAEDIQGAISGTLPAPEAEDVPEPPPAIPPGRTLYQECQEWGLRLTKAELEALVVGDDTQIDFVRQKLKIKKEAAQAPQA